MTVAPLNPWTPVFIFGQEFGSHHSGCDVLEVIASDNCTCGFRQTLAAALRSDRDLREIVLHFLVCRNCWLDGWQDCDDAQHLLRRTKDTDLESAAIATLRTAREREDAEATGRTEA